MMLNKIVSDLISEHEGGELFFDALDKEMQNNDIINLLIDIIKPEWGKKCSFITSGKFGIYLTSLFHRKDMILVNGGLRDGKIMNLEPYQEKIVGKNFLFLDDSFYLGRTRDKIKIEIERLGGTLKHTYVCYDGSIKKDKNVSSLYRYYK